MPEHVHLLMTMPMVGDPSVATEAQHLRPYGTRLFLSPTQRRAAVKRWAKICCASGAG